MKAFAWVSAVLVLLAGCGTTHRHRRPRAMISSQEPFPEQEEFEVLLERKGGLIDALLAIDRFVEPDIDTEGARRAYDALVEKVRPLVERAVAVGGSYGAALEVLGALKTAGFDYEDEQRDWAPLYGSVSRSLSARKGICLSFTLLGMALLESCGVDAMAACYPQHILMRVRRGDREIELESTSFGDPVRSMHPEDLRTLAETAGFYYGRSMDRTEAAWCYLAERLWAWVLKRSKDGRSFALLERAEEVLAGSDESTSMQWALRHLLRSTDRLCSAQERRESFRAAADEFERLIRWDRKEPRNYLFLSALYEDGGNPRSALEVLKRFMETEPGDRTAAEIFVQARWWIKREQLNVEGFLLTPEEKKKSEIYLERHFPYSERTWRLDRTYRRLFQSSQR